MTSYFNDPAYRAMVDRVADERLAFVEYLIERGELDAAREQLEQADADLAATPDGWELLEIRKLREQEEAGLTVITPEKIQAIVDEAERRRAEWIGEDEDG